MIYRGRQKKLNRATLWREESKSKRGGFHFALYTFLTFQVRDIALCQHVIGVI